MLDLEPILEDMSPQLWSLDREFKENHPFTELFREELSLVKSRAVSSQDNGLMMLPGLDFFNYSAYAVARLFSLALGCLPMHSTLA